MILAQITNNVETVTQAVTVLIHAVAPKLSTQDDLDSIGAVWMLARILRKAIPDNLQTGKFGTLIKHIALEINPPTQSNPVPQTPIQIQTLPPVNK